ncbi:MAG: hypothetical protein RL662_917 [Bacteroidota bacterium]
MKNYKYIFLDRDGVINIERKNDYVKNSTEFVFEKNALEAIAKLSQITPDIYIITNQRGVGRGVMSSVDLHQVHDFMLTEIQKANGNIKHIYFCTAVHATCINRKPNIGMAFQAQADYPEIDFGQSIMVGNSKSDIEFGKKAGMYTVLVGDKYTPENGVYKMADVHFINLYEFALSLQ